MNITEAVDMISEVVADSAAEVMISRVERCRLGRRLHTLSPSPLLERLSILGVEEHWHGDGTYESPCWTHQKPPGKPPALAVGRNGDAQRVSPQPTGLAPADTCRTLPMDIGYPSKT